MHERKKKKSETYTAMKAVVLKHRTAVEHVILGTIRFAFKPKHDLQRKS